MIHDDGKTNLNILEALNGLERLSKDITGLVVQRDEARRLAEQYRDEVYESTSDDGTCSFYIRKGQPVLPWEKSNE